MSGRLKDLGMILVGTGLVAYLLGGFVAGMVWCKDCDGILGNTLGRLFIGLVTCVLSAIHGGFAPENGAGVRPLNPWPFVSSSWFVLFAACVVLLRRVQSNVGLSLTEPPLLLRFPETDSA